MLRGDLRSTPLAPLLLDLAEDSATGCLNIVDATGDEADVYYKSGLVYAVLVPGTRPQLGAKLVSSGAVAPEALSEALEAQRTELQGWRLGELLVHLGYVDQPVVEAFVKEQVSEAVWDLLRWTDGEWKFRKNVKAREDVGPPMVVVELLEALRDRGYEWETISAVVHGPDAVPVLSTRSDTSAEMTLDNDAWSMLCKIDGERTVADLAGDCGYTLFEAGHVIVSLVQSGLVDIAEEVDVEGDEPYGASTLSFAFAGEFDDNHVSTLAEGDTDDDAPAGIEEDAMSRLARLVNEVAGNHALGDWDAADAGAGHAVRATAAVNLAVADTPSNSKYDNPALERLRGQSKESFAASMTRVSNALADVLGDAPSDTLTPEEMQQRQAARRRSLHSADDPDWQRRKRHREAAAAELASAHLLADTLRPEYDEATSDTPEFTGEIPKVATTESERRRATEREAEAAKRAAEEADRHAAEEAARAAADQFAKAAAEAGERHAAELAAQQAAREAAQRQAERVAAEEAAWDEYWHREEAERAAAAATAAQLAAELAELEAAEAAERHAAEEAERQAAEAAAQRLAAQEAERAAAAEAERLAAEAAERQAAAAETERLAAEAAERAATEEAERQAAAEAEAVKRQAAEERAQQERAAAEAAAEAERQAAVEVERQAAAEAEQAAAVAAERAAAEAAEKAAAEEETQRAARREAEKKAAEEAAQYADEQAAATALLVELASGRDESPPRTPEPAQPEAVEEVTPAPPAAVEDDPADDDRDETPETWSEAGMADTAALLRELSSLGVDDVLPNNGGSSPSRTPRAPHVDKKVKKKIGLFGL